jgi:hypothetical protein
MQNTIRTAFAELSAAELEAISGGAYTDHWWDINRDMCIGFGDVSMTDFLTAA